MNSPENTSPAPGWPVFRAAVLTDEMLHARLLATPDAAAFHRTALALASERGIPLEPAELDAAIAGARHAWLIRRVGL